jgi:probable F420-dependent oxidoreductase
MSRDEWVTLARHAEDLGYSTLTLPDHFNLAQAAVVPALQCAADATSTLRVAAGVFGNDYRHPLVLAKDVATIDALSNGRVELGIGAGWSKIDHAKTGIHMDPPGVRIDRLVEAVTIIKSAFGGEPFSFSGQYYTVDDYLGTPTPLQRPIPLMIGGSGPRMLRYAVTEAEIVGITAAFPDGLFLSSFESMTAEAVDKKLTIVRAAAEAAERWHKIELNILCFFVAVTDNTKAAYHDLASRLGATAEEIRESPFALIGPPSKIVEDLLERRERWGLSYIMIREEGHASIDEFARVVSALVKS